MKRGYGGGRSYDSSSNMSHGGGKSGKGGLKVPPMQTDTKSMGAVPQKSWKSSGANVKGSRLPSDGKPRR